MKYYSQKINEQKLLENKCKDPERNKSDSRIIHAWYTRDTRVIQKLLENKCKDPERNKSDSRIIHAWYTRDTRVIHA